MWDRTIVDIQTKAKGLKKRGLVQQSTSGQYKAMFDSLHIYPRGLKYLGSTFDHGFY